MMPGGRFCLNFGIDNEGRYLGNTGGHHMFDNFDKHWRALRDEGIITDIEYEKATFAQYYRDLDEFRAPIDDPDSSVSKAGLRLKSITSRLTKCPYEAAFLNSGGTMSNAEYAASLIPTMRSWRDPVFRTIWKDAKQARSTGSSTGSTEIVEAEVAADPAGHAMDYVHIILDMEKAP